MGYHLNDIPTLASAYKPGPLRKKWRQIGATIAALATVVVLAACASSSASPSSSGPVTITYWYWLDDPTTPTFTTLINQFNASHPGIHVVGQLVPLSNYEDKLITAIGAGAAPDAARFKDWWVGQFASQGALTSLQPYINQWNGRSDVLPALWNTGKLTSDGPVYMLPHQPPVFNSTSELAALLA